MFMENIKNILMKRKLFLYILQLVIFVFIVFLAVSVNNSNKKQHWEYYNSDIRYEYLNGIDFIQGKNPYTKVLQYNLLTNHKYATLFPLYYYYIGYVAKAVNFDYDTFLDVYRAQLYIAEIIGAVIIYLIFKRENKYLLGFVAATFFMFNRWTIANIIDGKQDVIAILFLMAFFYFFTSPKKKNKVISFLLFGISIGFKHVGIFIAPLLLLPFIRKEITFKDFIKGFCLFLIPTIVVGSFHILQNPLAFFYSMLFSFTRESSKLNTEFGYQNILVLYNVGVKNNNIIFYLLPRLPLVVFSVLNITLLWLKKLPPMLYCFTAMFIFIAFNPVLFSQYFTWIAPLVFLQALKFNELKQ
jgi:hypothetical protein